MNKKINYKSSSKRKRTRKFSDNAKGSKRYFDDYKEQTGDTETNDPAWYAKYPELMKDSASLPYSIPTGTFIKWDLDVDPTKPLLANATVGSSVPHQSIPGIMTLGVVPSVGVSTDATSPVNVATKMLYTKVRAENSGSRNYDAPDLMLYCLAMDQVYSMLTWFNRIYGTMMLYSQINRYVPRAMLKAQHVDFDDMILHINDFKSFLDTATAQAAVFSVPNDITLFNRHAFMYQNVYKDAESAKSQMYQFAPRVFYIYDEYNGAGKLVPYDVVASNPNGCKFIDLVNMFHTVMNPIIASEDFNIMSGDILKAFGADHLIKLQIMPSGYTIYPITDYEVLTQIKNATITNYTTPLMLTLASGNLDIHQDANVEYIEYNPYFVYGGSDQHGICHDRMLSTYKTTPEPADNMVYSRLMYVVKEVERTDAGGSTVYDVYFDSVGSEFISGVNITQFYENTNDGWTLEDTALQVVSENSLSGIYASTMYKLFLAKHFDFSPALYLLCTFGGANTVFYPWFDTDNWTIVHAYELSKMHRTALMSMLRVPMIGSALPSNA